MFKQDKQNRQAKSLKKEFSKDSKNQACTVLTLAIVVFFTFSFDLLANTSSKKPRLNKKNKSNSQQMNLSVEERNFLDLKSKHRNGKISKTQFWRGMSKIIPNLGRLSYPSQLSLVQLNANILKETGYPLSAALQASQAIMLAKNPMEEDVKPAWKLLKDIADTRTIDTLLEILAKNLLEKNNQLTPPYFFKNWNYYVGNSLAKEAKTRESIVYFDKIQTNDSHFGLASYQKAMLKVEQGELKDAELDLSILVHPSVREKISDNHKANEKLFDLSYLALGRINYEQKDFQDAFTAYRLVRKDSPYFYEALFEQAWAFFMGGYPNQALGALHGAESPFFDKKFNPEVSILKSSIYYWMCLYEDSKVGLREFLEKHSKSVETLAKYFHNRKLEPDTAYEIFENYISGVSPETIGIPIDVLDTAATSDGMMFLRSQYADILQESERLKKYSTGKRVDTNRAQDYLRRLTKSMQIDIGREFSDQLMLIKQNYEVYYEQAQFLYVELLMSEKDHLLGKELHADSKITTVSSANVKGWGKTDYSWKDGVGQEYWWDEIGHFVYRAKPACNIQ